MSHTNNPSAVLLHLRGLTVCVAIEASLKKNKLCSPVYLIVRSLVDKTW